MNTLGDELPREMARVRNIIPAYKATGRAGVFALLMMETALDQAARAMAEGDAVKMLHCYQHLKGFTS